MSDHYGTPRAIETYRRLEELKQLREMQAKFFESGADAPASASE